MKVLSWSCCCLLLVCGAAALTDERKAELKLIGLGCLKEKGVTDEELKNLKAGPSSAADITDNLKCALHCIMVKAKYMNDAGTFDAEAYKSAYAEKPGVQEAVDQCKAVAGANPCETASMISACLHLQKMELVQ